MQVVGAGIGRLGQRHDPLAQGVGKASRRGPATIAMDQGGRPPEAVLAAQAARLPLRSAHQVGRFGHPDLPSLKRVENREALLCTLRQDDLPHNDSGFRPGRGRTFSLVN
jgi:hypothetical protein